LDVGREWYELDPQNGEKMCLKMLEDISRSPTSSGGECFLAENKSKDKCHRSLGINYYGF